MFIHGKVGTHSQERLQVRKQGKSVSALKVGDVIDIKRHPYEKHAKWLEVRIWKADGIFFLEYV